MKITVSIPQLQSLAGPAAFLRGKDYAENGLVESVYWEQPFLVGDVRGSAPEPYRVSIRVQVNEATWSAADANCDCPYEGMWCKHAVAVMLIAESESESLLAQVPLKQRIEALSPDECKRLLLRMASDEALRQPASAALDIIERRGKDGLNFSKVEKETRRELRRMFQHSMGGSWRGYSEASEVLSDVMAIMKRVQGLMEDGDHNQAIAVMAGVLDEFFEVWMEIDDEAGEGVDLVQEIAGTLLDAVFHCDLDPEDRTHLTESAGRWNEEASQYDGTEGTSAVVIGLKYGPSVEGLREAAEDFDSETIQMVARAWLTYLGENEQDAEYLAYSQAMGLHTLRAIRLIETGRVAEGVSDAEEHLASGPEALSVVLALKHQGSLGEALRLGMKALTEFPEERGLAPEVAQIAEMDKAAEYLLPLQQQAWKVDPSFSRYQRIKELAGDAWPGISTILLEGVSSKYGDDDAYRILLAEEDVEGLIKLLEMRMWIGGDTLQEVVACLVGRKPQWVIDYFHARATEAIGAGRSQEYPSAVIWLGWVRDAYRAIDREEDWQATKSACLKEYWRKRSLVPMLEKL